MSTHVIMSKIIIMMFFAQCRGFHIVVPVARIVSVASNFWKRRGRSYGNALAITQDDPCDRNDQSSEIDSSSILATETTGKDSQAIAYF